jgi:regulator of replication initiation timing
MNKTIKIESIRIDGGTQARASLDQNTVAEYAEAMEHGAKFPPVVVFFDGADHWLADGFHRYFGSKKIGALDIEAEVREGTKRDAILFSLGANAHHGLRRTNADKRKAVETLLNDAEWAKWSDRQIAKACGVGHPLVASVRFSLESDSSEKPAERTYTTKHGTKAVMKTNKIGKAQQIDPKPAKRQVAQPPEAAPTSDDELAELHHTITDLAAENERLSDRLAVEAMDASEEEKTAAAQTIAELRNQVSTMEAELSAVKASRDTYMRENKELKQQCASQRRELERLRKAVTA